MGGVAVTLAWQSCHCYNHLAAIIVPKSRGIYAWVGPASMCLVIL